MQAQLFARSQLIVPFRVPIASRFPLRTRALFGSGKYTNIAEVEIQELKNEIKRVEVDLSEATDKKTIDYLRKKELSLRKDMAQLRKDMAQLREKEEQQLRKEVAQLRKEVAQLREKEEQFHMKEEKFHKKEEQLRMELLSIREVPLDKDATRFFAMLRNGTVPDVGDLLSVGSGDVFFPLHKGTRMWQLYVRSCYPDLFNVIYESISRMHIVTGTPGIGKSFFFYYMLLRLLHSPTPPPFILWEHFSTPGKMWCYTSDSGLVRSGNRDAFVSELDNVGSWYFADGVSPHIFSMAHTVLLTSPKRETIKEMAKEGAWILYMPLWEYDELLACRSKLYGSVPKATVENLFNCYGGVARYVLQHPSWNSNVELPVLLEPILSVIHGCNVVQVQQAIYSIETGPEASHQLLHIIADDNFNKQCILFASRWAANEFTKRAWVTGRQQLVTLLARCDGSMRGMVYEAMMHNVLARGGTFDVVQLDPKTLARGEKKKLDIQPCDEFRFCEDVSDMATAGNIYLIPKSRKFSAIDIIKVPEMYFFQMTVATSQQYSSSFSGV